MPEDETQNPNQNPSHLLVEQGLFSRTADAPSQSTPMQTDPVTQSAASDPTLAEDVASYEGDGSLISKLKSNLFLVILIPMVLIELILLILIIRH